MTQLTVRSLCSLRGYSSALDAITAAKHDPRAAIAERDGERLHSEVVNDVFYRSDRLTVQFQSRRLLSFAIDNNGWIQWEVDEVFPQGMINWSTLDRCVLKFEGSGETNAWDPKEVCEAILGERSAEIFPNEAFVFAYFGNTVVGIRPLLNVTSLQPFVLFTETD